MRCAPLWADKIHDKENTPQCIYDVCFSPDGSQLIAAAGFRVLVYNPTDGSLIQSLKGHKDTVYCVNYSKDGKRFASGGADKLVIIWTADLQGILKYTSFSHNDSIQCLSFNPATHQLASCAVSDFGLWALDTKAVTKHKTPGRVNSCAWNTEGQILALGCANGLVSLRQRTGEEISRFERPGGSLSPVWAIQWIMRKDDEKELLCVTDWGQNMAFYNSTEIVTKDRPVNFMACRSAKFSHSGAQFLLIGGSNRSCGLYSSEGAFLGNVAEHENWVWGVASHPTLNHVAVGSQDGTLAVYQVLFNTVHGLYRERYAFREALTDVIVHHLLDDEKARIRCRDLVRKVAIYKNLLAVQLTEKIIIYELESGTSMYYKVKEKILEKVDCSLLVACTHHLVLCQDRRLQSVTLTGEKAREWELDAPIRYMRVVGGPPGREGLLVGLRSGVVLKIFLDNPFAVQVVKCQAPIRCLDVSPSRKQIAVVDELGVCQVYDMETGDAAYQESGAASVAWNTNCEQLLCFSGIGMLSIKVGEFPCHQQNFSGFVVGFHGSRLFCLQGYSMTTLDVPLSAPMYQYIERGLFSEAFVIACQGVTEFDWVELAHKSLASLDLDIARKACLKIRDLPKLKLIQTLLHHRKDTSYCLAEILAHEGKFQDSSKLFAKIGRRDLACDLLTNMKLFDLAQEYTTEDSKGQMLKAKAVWAENSKDPQTAAQLLLEAGETKKAIITMAENGLAQMLIDLGRTLNAKDMLKLVAEKLQHLGEMNAVTEVLKRAEDWQFLAKIIVQTNNWSEALSLLETRPNLVEIILPPYASYLASERKIDKAQTALIQAGRQTEARVLVESQLETNLEMKKNSDVAHCYWLLARCSGSMERFKEYYERCILFRAYFLVCEFVREPFTSALPETLFNAARLILITLSDYEYPKYKISKVTTLFTFCKQAHILGAHKTANELLKQFELLRIAPELKDRVAKLIINLKSKSPKDSDALLPLCFRCSASNPILGSRGNRCTHCLHPFIISSCTYDILPLVEFELDPSLTHPEALNFLKMEPKRQETNGSPINQIQEIIDDIDDPFMPQIASFQGQRVSEYIPFVASKEVLRLLKGHEVIVSKVGGKFRYYRLMLPSMSLSTCEGCGQVVETEEWEAYVLEHKRCPFCFSQQ